MSQLPALCIRCEMAYPDQAGDWLHCEPCYQIVCNEIADAEAEERTISIPIPPHPDDPDRDARDEIAELMMTQGLTFIEAVEELLVERWGLEWLRSQQGQP